MNKLTLFCELKNDDIFHFYDNPTRKLVKDDRLHYICPEGRRPISPTVLVKKDKVKRNGNKR